MLLSALATSAGQSTCVQVSWCAPEDCRPNPAVKVTFARWPHCLVGTYWWVCQITYPTRFALERGPTILNQSYFSRNLTPAEVFLIYAQINWFFGLAAVLSFVISRLFFLDLSLTQRFHELLGLKFSSLLWVFGLWHQSPQLSSIDSGGCGTAQTTAH